eukprot:TRINITY_DN12613_c0_g2_i1.p1 TRINITY_DN12613_c0_g2~~TRINITY_DN12613_c0_g2_i1.p1  ORF type:complete len:634 (-),score=62.37 TRINITY_DN12613_c0_g2_i1:373-2043(-)
MAENAMMPSVSRSLNWCIRVVIFVFILEAIIWVFLNQVPGVCVRAIVVFAACSASAYLMIVILFLRNVRLIAQKAVAVGSGRRAETARRALSSIKWQCSGVFVCVGWIIISRLWLVFSAESDWQSNLISILHAIDCSCGQILVLAFSRGVTATSFATRQCDGSSRHRSWQKASQLYNPEQDQRWGEKVKELSGRGFTLEKLLDFYQMLGNECMPHFVPSRSTTDDVVHGAIIPLSCTEKCAMATVMMGGAYAKPHKMVTHCWRNLFRDLVSAIVADALGESEFNRIAHLVERDIPLLRRWVNLLGAHSRIYWVCAFSVNQHAGICGNNPHNSKDTVTAELYPTCECNLPKAFNTDAPVLENGKGIECEMNKFQDMIRFLSATDRHFEQVIAIDAGFALFSRSWCIAEIFVANTIGMKQHLKIFAAGDIIKHSSLLSNLKVEAMESSLPEDKVEILASIPDIPAFNERLQVMLFDELLPAWESLDDEEVAECIGQFVRWERLSADRSSIGIFEENHDIPLETPMSAFSALEEHEIADIAAAEAISESSESTESQLSI